MPRFADLKIWVRLTAAIWLVLALIWVGAILWTTQVNRDTAIRQAKDFSQSIHEMTMAGLTGMMITGTVGQREVFLDQIKRPVDHQGSARRPWRGGEQALRPGHQGRPWPR